jgi:hypothetical protein
MPEHEHCWCQTWAAPIRFQEQCCWCGEWRDPMPGDYWSTASTSRMLSHGPHKRYICGDPSHASLKEALWHHHKADGLETDPEHCRLCQDAGLVSGEGSNQ